MNKEQIKAVQMGLATQQELLLDVVDAATVSNVLVLLHNLQDAARASNRGFARLHRKIDARDAEIERLKRFIDSRQLTGEYVQEREQENNLKRARWEGKERAKRLEPQAQGSSVTVDSSPE